MSMLYDPICYYLSCYFCFFQLLSSKDVPTDQLVTMEDLYAVSVNWPAESVHV